MKKYILIVLLAGCSTTIYPNHILAINTLCKEHSGVARVWSDLDKWNLQCVDGTYFYKIGQK